MGAQLDGMIAPIQMSATSIQTISFRDGVVRITIRQDDQRVFFFEILISSNILRGQQQELKHTIARVGTVDNGEIDG
jgi:hypothetical protein